MSEEMTGRAMKAARAAGLVGSRFVVIGTYGADREPGIHRTVRQAAERHGMHVKSSSSGPCCLPCNGSGYVDDATAVGCVRSSMRCPACHGRGDFIMTAPKLARPDGWPLCPLCGEDELACLATPEPPEYEWTMARYLEHELFCYACGKVTWQP
jgi:hypothetical protein